MPIRLDKLVVDRGFAPSRTRAQAMIEAGKISVNGVVVLNTSRGFAHDAEIVALEPDIPWVSRAALKLVRALDAFAVDPKDRIALDIGASTGGFTEVLLSRGAKHVYAIDVGTSQMHDKLLYDDRITVREGVHIRDVKSEDFAEAPALIVIDVSFISLSIVLPIAAQLLAPKGDIVALIKPQFEVGKENIGKGVVRDPELHKAVRERIALLGKELGFKVHGPIDSPIEGGDGNIEFLIHLSR